VRKNRGLVATATAILTLLFAGVCLGSAALHFAQSARADRAERRAADQATLDQAERLLRGGQVGPAGTILDPLDGQAFDNDLRERLNELKWAAQLARTAETLRTERYHTVSGTRTLSRFTTFGKEQLQFQIDSDAEVVDRVKRSAAVESIVALFDTWASVCGEQLNRSADAETTAQLVALRDRLLRILRAVDPGGDLRDQIRDARNWTREKLPQLARARHAHLPSSVVGLLADQFLIHGLDGEAILIAHQARYPADFWINYQLGTLLSRKQDKESARGYSDLERSMQFFSAALALRPNDSSVLAAMGTALSYKEENFPEAIRFFNQALAANPNNSMAHNNLGVLRREQREFADAEQCFRNAVRADPVNAMALINLGSAICKDKPDEAIELYERAIEAEPRDASIRYRYGSLLQDLNRLPAAERQYLAALEYVSSVSSPPRSWIHNNLGFTLCKQRKFHEAATQYELAAEADPDNPWPLYNQAFVIEQMRGDLHKARALLAKCLDLKTIPMGNEVVGELAEAAKQRLDRIFQYSDMLPRALSDDIQADSAVELLGLAEVCYHNRKFFHALRFYEDAFVQSPQLLEVGLHRFRAACAAALASAASHQGAKPDSDAERRKSARDKALLWLGDELEAIRESVRAEARDTNHAHDLLEEWAAEEGIQAAFDKQVISSFSETEQAQWNGLWSGRESLLRELAR
jgi:tetratricopeptide (TPR) repeat protein